MFLKTHCIFDILEVKHHTMETMLIQLTNKKAAGLIQELESLELIRVLKANDSPVVPKLSDKYRGIISKEQGQDLNKHIEQMRSEWNNI